VVLRSVFFLIDPPDASALFLDFGCALLAVCVQWCSCANQSEPHESTLDLFSSQYDCHYLAEN